MELGFLIQWSSKASKINTYVGEDGLLHFTDCEGADSVLPFSKGENSIIIHDYFCYAGTYTKNLSAGKYRALLAVFCYQNYNSFDISSSGSLISTLCNNVYQYSGLNGKLIIKEFLLEDSGTITFTINQSYGDGYCACGYYIELLA